VRDPTSGTNWGRARLRKSSDRELKVDQKVQENFYHPGQFGDSGKKRLADVRSDGLPPLHPGVEEQVTASSKPAQKDLVKKKRPRYLRATIKGTTGHDIKIKQPRLVCWRKKN